MSEYENVRTADIVAEANGLLKHWEPGMTELGSYW